MIKDFADRATERFFREGVTPAKMVSHCRRG
jgi:hypothetical protein